ncbi:MAG TPA: hypothetical protein VFM46_16750, partial [Pseudomonadales bacterium]|nr:hypothetical protein [Pseudomonadales bacterium]
TLRLYMEINLLDTKLGDVNIPNAIIKSLGDPRVFSLQRGTHNYKVAEVKFAVFPQKSGELKIPPMTFEAVVEVPGTQDQFFMFGGPDTKHIVLKSEELTVQVKPKPQNYPANAPWLPARQLELSENWSGDTNNAKVGEPLTRTLTINASGQLASALPNVETGKTNGYKIYPDKPQTDEKSGAQGIESTHKEALAVVPTNSGAITLPATKIYWWNTETDKLEIAELHSKTLMVGGATNAAPTTITPPPSPAEAEQAVAPTPEPTPLPVSAQNDHVRIWQAACATLALLWMATIGLYLHARKAKWNAPASEGEDPNAKLQKQIVTLKHLREQAISACHHHQPQTARDSVVKYFAALTPKHNIHSLGDIKRHVADAGIVSCIDELESILYKDDTATWDGNNLAKALGQLKLTKVDKHFPKPLLDALYPI